MPNLHELSMQAELITSSVDQESRHQLHLEDVCVHARIRSLPQPVAQMCPAVNSCDLTNIITLFSAPNIAKSDPDGSFI